MKRSFVRTEHSIPPGHERLRPANGEASRHRKRLDHTAQRVAQRAADVLQATVTVVRDGEVIARSGGAAVEVSNTPIARVAWEEEPGVEVVV